ncbi:MAG: alginate lyase family protein, partial [Victivallales bacterium]|nr:alginate lyase family protein [Victivallales bacterium]
MNLKSLPILFAMTITTLSAAMLDLGDFHKTPWSGMQAVNGPCPVPLPKDMPPDTPVACWKDLPKNPTLMAPKFPENLSRFTHFDFWMYSSKKNNQGLTIYFDSENPESEGGDYYYYHLTVDWEGWRHFHLSTTEDIGISRSPLGWNHVSALRFHSTGWGHDPLPTSLFYFTGFSLNAAALDFTADDFNTVTAPVLSMTAKLNLKNDDDAPHDVVISIHENPDSLVVEGLPEMPIKLQANESKSLPVRLQLPAGKTLTPMQSVSLRLQAKTNFPSDGTIIQELVLVQPLVLPPHPRLFATSDDLKRLNDRAETFPWARETRNSYIKYAERIIAEPLNIPTMEGQWPHHYVCKKCGVGLRHVDGKHQCPRCNAVYTGWPYDQVVAGNVHGSNWGKVKTLGIAYAFTKREEFAEMARKYLLAYVEQYPKFKYHNIYNVSLRHGGRMLAQTLDEAVSVIPMAWGYDLAYNSPCFTPEDHKAIEDKLFREIAVTILRNDAGISNWQTWHNTAIAAIGFTIGDHPLIQKAIFGKSGMLFQFQNSILKDGFWYEGT